MKKIFKWLFWSSLTLIFLVVAANAWVVGKSTAKIKDSIDDLKEADVALVLGTSKSTIYGGENPFFADRMRGAAELFKAGKVKHIIVSGDNRSKYYNEPKDMLAALKALGVPSEAVTLDYAGLRTLDSVVRCKEIFEQSEIIIVTQSFHAYRAVFIADYYEINAQAYTANFESRVFISLLFREVIARSLAVVDLYILNRSPRHLGDKEKLNNK